MKMREITEREHKVKHHPLESPSHQKVKPHTMSSICFFFRRKNKKNLKYQSQQVPASVSIFLAFGDF